jgi:hypothetical protein
MARRMTLAWPPPSTAVYSPDTSGIKTMSAAPQIPMSPSSLAYTFSGCRARLTTFDSSNDPAHIPPMKVPSNTASDTADEPITNCNTWNQTI